MTYLMADVIVCDQEIEPSPNKHENMHQNIKLFLLEILMRNSELNLRLKIHVRIWGLTDPCTRVPSCGPEKLYVMWILPNPWHVTVPCLVEDQVYCYFLISKTMFTSVTTWESVAVFQKTFSLVSQCAFCVLVCRGEASCLLTWNRTKQISRLVISSLFWVQFCGPGQWLHVYCQRCYLKRTGARICRGGSPFQLLLWSDCCSSRCSGLLWKAHWCSKFAN